MISILKTMPMCFIGAPNGKKTEIVGGTALETALETAMSGPWAVLGQCRSLPCTAQHEARQGFLSACRATRLASLVEGAPGLVFIFLLVYLFSLIEHQLLFFLKEKSQLLGLPIPYHMEILCT